MYTFNTLAQALQDLTSDNDDEFIDELPNIIKRAEARIMRDLNLELFESVLEGVSTASGSRLVALPPAVVMTSSLWFQAPPTPLEGDPPGPPTRHHLVEERGYAYCLDYAPDEILDVGLPKYYAEMIGLGELDCDIPTISLLAPATILAGVAVEPTLVTITGTGFAAYSVVHVDGAPRATTYVSPTSVTFEFSVAELANSDTMQITVVNPCGHSGQLEFSVTCTVPTLTLLAPASVAEAGGVPVTVTLTGTGFAAHSVVYVDAVVRESLLISPIEIEIELSAEEVAAAGLIDIYVENPCGTSATLQFTVTP